MVLDVMTQLGHTDPAFTLRVYGHAMRRDQGARERLKALLEGPIPAQKGTGALLNGSWTASTKVRGRRNQRPSPGTSSDGRGGFRTCDLSRVKRALSH